MRFAAVGSLPTVKTGMMQARSTLRRSIRRLKVRANSKAPRQRTLMTKPDLGRDYGALVSGSHPGQRETALRLRDGKRRKLRRHCWEWTRACAC